MRDYYLPPTDHPRQAEIEELQESLARMKRDLKNLEAISDDDFTEQDEIEYQRIEQDIADTDNLINTICEA